MKDWTATCPPYDSQYSLSTHTDTMNCVEESLCHIVYMLTGRRFSGRALGFMVDVTPTGSNVEQALEVANTKGLIPYDLWPTPDTFTWDSYYAPIPQEILDQAVKVKIEMYPASLDISPLWTQLNFPNGASHMVAEINGSQYFDSEMGATIKPLNYAGATQSFKTSLKVTLLDMTKKFRIQDGTKLGIAIFEGFTGTVLFADSIEHYNTLCAAYGITETTPLIQLPQ